MVYLNGREERQIRIKKDGKICKCFCSLLQHCVRCKVQNPEIEALTSAAFATYFEGVGVSLEAPLLTGISWETRTGIFSSFTLNCNVLRI